MMRAHELSRATSAAQAFGAFPVRPSGPASLWTDIVKAPLHDFPIRDEILFQHVVFPATAEVLEVGPGSGFTAFRLAREVKHITLLDVSSRAIENLRAELGRTPNLAFVCDDVTSPGLPERLGRAFDIVFALDMFEYVTDPAACLRNLAAALRPGGELFLTFPNVPPPVGDGATWFTDLSVLERMLGDAGLATWEVFAVRPNRVAAALYQALHEWPMRAYRRVRAGDRQARPQIYEATWAFQHRTRLLRIKPAVHFYWALLGRAMRVGGDVFVRAPIRQPLGRQLVIRGVR